MLNKNSIFIFVLLNIINKNFYRNVKFRVHSGPTEKNTNKPRFKSNSNWLPDKLPICVETFITAVNHETKSSKTKKRSHGNLAISEQEGILNLQNKKQR